MVYDWEDKRESCYRMWVDEKRTMDEVIKYFKEEIGFVPSKRAFQTQFKRWGFPSKQNPAHRNEALVARTRELWEKNTTQKDMVAILHSEGFMITERELMRVRAKHRLLLRGPNATRSEQDLSTVATAEASASMQLTPEVRRAFERSMDPAIDKRIQEHDDSQFVLDSMTGVGSSNRNERSKEIRRESDEKWQSKKRRRRTRGWAGLPADPPGPPRFPSETTLEASKACLDLDNVQYVRARDQFEAICREHDVVKKTTAGPEKWQAAKEQLIGNHEQLKQAFRLSEPTQTDRLHLSLDVICMDVTKRMRGSERAMTLAEAKNLLGINPEKGRQLRQALIDLLTANNFVNKHESGNWEQLRQKWVMDSGLLQRIAPIESQEHEKGLRAIQMICRDIMKRWRDMHVNSGQVRAPVHQEVGAGTILAGSQLQASHSVSNEDMQSDYDFQIDPSLLVGAREQALTFHSPYTSNTGHPHDAVISSGQGSHTYY